MVCPICGTKNKEDALFCRKCGAKLHSEMVTGNTQKRSKTVVIILGIVAMVLCIAVVILYLKTDKENTATDTEEPEVVSQKEEVNKEQITEAYTNFLEADPTYNYYAILDMNGDNVPELLAAENTVTDESTNYPENALLVSYADVYTYEENKVIEAGSIGAQIPLKMGNKTDGLYTTWGGSGYYQIINYRLNEKNVIENWYLTVDLDDGTVTYGMNDEQKSVDSEKEEEIRNQWDDTEYVLFSDVTDMIDGEITDENGIDDNIDSYTECDYTLCTDLDNYEYWESPEGDYFFWCPKGMYPDPIEYDDEVYFTSEENNADSLSFQRLGNENGDSAVEAVARALEDIAVDLDGEILRQDEVVKKDGLAHGVICGIGMGGENQYISIAADDNYTYYMYITIRHSGNEEEKKQMNYYLETMYRYCSFNDTYSPRTYEEYLEDPDDY